MACGCQLMMNESERELVCKKIQKLSPLKCYRCASVDYELVGETFVDLWNHRFEKTAEVPAYLIACSNCGALSMHAMAIIDEVEIEM